MTNPYDETFTVPVGENVFSINPDSGAVTARRKPPEYRSSIWKDARQTLGCSDNAIELVSERESGKCYYRVNGVTVTFVPTSKRSYNCLKPQCGLHGDCPHIRRLDRYRRETVTADRSVDFIDDRDLV